MLSAALLALACGDDAPDTALPACDAALKCDQRDPEQTRSGVGRSPGGDDTRPDPCTRCDASRPQGEPDAGPKAGSGPAAGSGGSAPPQPDASVDAGHDAGVIEPEPMVIGIDFESIATVTKSNQTVPHMALTGLTILPGDHGLLVWEKSGRIVHYRIDGDRFVLQGEIRLSGFYTGSDCGLVSVAVDPSWEDNGFLFAGHCVTPTESTVVRLEFHGDDYEAAPKTVKTVLSFGDPRASKAWHNVGAIGFFDDPQHSLWILAGEKTVSENAQDTSNDLGGILRVIPNRDPSGSGYTPHPDNPFAGGDPGNTSSPNLYAWGLRSPWRGSIDARNRIWVGDVGSDNEEINLAFEPGQNFGWSLNDGPCMGEPPTCEPYSDPLAFWPHTSKHQYRREDPQAAGGTKRCVWVGDRYEKGGPDVYHGFLDDALLAGDMCTGFVRAFAVGDDNAMVRDQAVGHLVGVSGMTQAPDGYLYVTSFGSCSSATLGFGGIYRVIPRFDQPPPPDPPPPSGLPLVDDPLGPLPLSLAATGIFADETRTLPIERAVRFEPTLPLYSDDLGKERWLLLPPGTQVDNSDRAAWKFPTGTLFFKTFIAARSDGGTYPVETRLIRKTADGWTFDAYMWRGSDADLLALELPVTVPIDHADGSLDYHDIPSRFDCHTCHDANDTVIIGFDELRMNGPRSGGSLSQLVELDQKGLFTNPLPADPDSILTADATTAQVEGYLHGNCSHCHNSSPSAPSVLVLEHAVAVANVVGKPTEGSGQAAGTRVIAGDAAHSVLFQAFSGETSDQEVQAMPPLGISRRDSAAIELLRGWIDGL